MTKNTSFSLPCQFPPCQIAQKAGGKFSMHIQIQTRGFQTLASPINMTSLQVDQQICTNSWASPHHPMSSASLGVTRKCGRLHSWSALEHAKCQRNEGRQIQNLKGVSFLDTFPAYTQWQLSTWFQVGILYNTFFLDLQQVTWRPLFWIKNGQPRTLLEFFSQNWKSSSGKLPAPNYNELQSIQASKVKSY